MDYSTPRSIGPHLCPFVLLSTDHKTFSSTGSKSSKPNRILHQRQSVCVHHYIIGLTASPTLIRRYQSIVPVLTSMLWSYVTLQIGRHFSLNLTHMSSIVYSWYVKLPVTLSPTLFMVIDGKYR